jgi:hypothetical protein
MKDRRPIKSLYRQHADDCFLSEDACQLEDTYVD